MTLSCFTQPEPFLRSIMPRLVADSNGLLDRFLICLPPTTHLPINDRIECSKTLKNSLVSFDKLYERIYAKHNTADKIKYCLEEEALDIYVKHTSHENSSPQETCSASGNAKDDKNIIRLAAVIHVLFTMIDQALNQGVEDIPTKISARTMTAAIALAGYFEKQRAILRQVILFKYRRFNIR